MGLLDEKCLGCGKKYPAYRGGPGKPKVGTVVQGPGFIYSGACCGSCWGVAETDGFNLYDKAGWDAWSAKMKQGGKAGKAQRAATAVMKAHETEAKIKSIKISTGPVPWPYEIEGVVFNIASDAGLFSFIKAGPEEAVRRAEAMLKLQAHERGCDAVIHTIFEHRITVDADVFGKAQQGIEIFAYGTAVKRRS